MPDEDRKESKSVKWYEPKDAWGESNYVHCHILNRWHSDNGREEYTVELLFFDFHNEKPLTEKDLTFDPSKPDKEDYIDYQVPRHAIKWNEMPFNDDEHLPNAFRHPIGFPDHFWPQGWTTKQ